MGSGKTSVGNRGPGSHQDSYANASRLLANGFAKRAIISLTALAAILAVSHLPTLPLSQGHFLHTSGGSRDTGADAEPRKFDWSKVGAFLSF
jgi:hypothetical protein